MALNVRLITAGSQRSRHRPGGTRTPNRRFWRPVLYQLSYGPLNCSAPACADCEWPGAESNRRHRGFQPRALPPELPGQTLGLSTSPTNQTPPVAAFDRSSGGRIRTCDLRVMSPTSYLTAPPRNRKGKLLFVRKGVNPSTPPDYSDSGLDILKYHRL